MSWNIATDDYLVFDLSTYQRDPATGKPPDLVAVKRLNPRLAAVYIRCALWDDPTPDYAFEALWDSAGEAELPTMVYQVSRPDRDPEAQVSNLHRILGNRKPAGILNDAERADGKTASHQLTFQGRWLAFAHQAFPDSPWTDFYTANWYWAPIGQAEWMKDLTPVVAAYPYANALLRRQYTDAEAFITSFNFASSFPRVPAGFGGAGGWQFSSKLKVAGIANTAGSPSTDGNLFTAATVARIRPTDQPGTQPPITPDAPARIREEALALRGTADALDRIANEIEDGR